MHILVVDDEEVERKGAVRLLKKMGHTTCVAATGEEALERLRIEAVDLVLLDMMLGPGMSGWDVAWWCKIHAETAAIPIIVFTGLAPDAVRRGQEDEPPNKLAGVVAVVGKPLEAAELFRYISALTK